MESSKAGPPDVPAEGVGPAASAAGSGNASVAVGFIRANKLAELIAACLRIEKGMTGNPVYPAPVPTLATFTAARDALVAKAVACDGGAKAVVERNQARVALEGVLRGLAAYVQHAAQGNAAKLMGSGFPVQKRRGGANGLMSEPPPAPVGLRVRRGNGSGQIIVRCRTGRTTLLYQWRYATAQAPTAWTLSDTSSASSFVFDGLVAATQYVLQVRAYGRRGVSDWSESVSVIAT